MNEERNSSLKINISSKNQKKLNAMRKKFNQNNKSATPMRERWLEEAEQFKEYEKKKYGKVLTSDERAELIKEKENEYHLK